MKRKIGFVLSAAFAMVLALLILPKGEARRSAFGQAGSQAPHSAPEQPIAAPATGIKCESMMMGLRRK